MNYLVTYFNDFNHDAVVPDFKIHTCIVNGKINVLKLFVKYLANTEWSSFGDKFKCSCDLYYTFSLDHDTKIEWEYSTINYETLHEKIINNNYICNQCHDAFNDKGNEIINFIKKIYNDTIDDCISITPDLRQICKMRIKSLNNLKSVSTDGIVHELVIPVLSDDDTSFVAYDHERFNSRAEDVVS